MVVGSVCGAVLVFESVLRRTVWQDKFELTYVAPSQVLLKALQDKSMEPMTISSQLGLEIDDIRIMGIKYLFSNFQFVKNVILM